VFALHSKTFHPKGSQALIVPLSNNVTRVALQDQAKRPISCKETFKSCRQNLETGKINTESQINDKSHIAISSFPASKASGD
jgi:hypothetical protein